jgi:hypothetical protein
MELAKTMGSLHNKICRMVSDRFKAFKVKNLMSSDNASPPANVEAIMLENLVADVLDAQQLEEAPPSQNSASKLTDQHTIMNTCRAYSLRL